MIRKNFLLILIFLLAFWLRVYKLQILPFGFYEEEVTNAYVGRFILQNGVDLYGNRWPVLYFDKFGDYPPVLPMYLSGIGTYFFGVNEFGARFPTALAGALTIFPVYILALFLFKDRRQALLTALFLAVLPWHIVLSRTGAEGVVGLAVYATAMVLVLQGIKRKNRRFLWWSLGLFALTYFLYPSFRLIVPLTLAPLPFLASHNKNSKRFLFAGAIALLLFTVAISLTTWGKGRFMQTSLLGSDEAATHIALKLQRLSFGDGPGNVRLVRLFHNKPVEYVKAFLDQYLSYFSPKHLFLEAGGQYRYYNVPYQGLAYLTLGFLIFGAFLPGGQKIDPLLLRYAVYLFLIAPLPAAVTVDFPPHVHRSILMILPLILMAATGAGKILDLLKKTKLAFAIIILFLAVETVYFWHQYAAHSPSLQSVLRNDGDRELIRYLIARQGDYDKVIVPVFARLPIYYLFFSGNFDKALAGRFKSEIKIDQVGKIEFFGDWCPSKFVKSSQLPLKTLVIDSATCSGSELTLIDIISRRDSTKAYLLLTSPQVP